MRVLLMAIMVIASALVLVAGQRGGAQPQATIPRTPDGKPDFSGFWSTPRQAGARGTATVFTQSKMAPFKPGAEE